jgi:hypothetical protein
LVPPAATAKPAAVDPAAGGVIQGRIDADNPPAKADAGVRTDVDVDRSGVRVDVGGRVDGNIVNVRDNNDWRYRYHGGRWWYWMPNNQWRYYDNDSWHVYIPGAGIDIGRGSYPYYSGYRGYYPYSYGRYYGRRYYGPRYGRGFGVRVGPFGWYR